MHSVFARINNVSAFLSTCVMCLLSAIALSSLFFVAYPEGTLSVLSVKVLPATGRRYSSREQDVAFVHFNISSDLTPLFNWNTRQLFLYLSAEYTDAENVKNDVVIWDRIVRRKEDAVVNVVGRNKYMLRDLSRTFKNAQPSHYALKYNLMPHVGYLWYGEAGRTTAAVAFSESQQHI